MNVYRNEQGIVVATDLLTGGHSNVDAIYVVDTGDNVLEVASPNDLERLQANWARPLREGRVNIVGLTTEEKAYA